MQRQNENHHLFCRGNSYYFSCYMSPRANQTVLTYDEYELRPISDEQFGGIAFVKKEGRIGILLFDSGNPDHGQWLFKANTFPFIFDEVWMPSYTEHDDVYLAVRIGTKWGVLRLYDTKNYHAEVKGWCVPWEHTTRQSAINAIRAKYDKSRLQWVNVEE